MYKFIIKPNEFLKSRTIGYCNSVYKGGGIWQIQGTIENLICTFKNDITRYSEKILQDASHRLKEILRNDLPKILAFSGKKQLIVCIVPRAKVNYRSDQLYFKKTVSEVLKTLNGFFDGTDYIIRIKDTATTHLARAGFGGNGPMPYPGITKDTCKISDNVNGKDILLIDDLYTKTVNIDEDAIQALLEHGASSVIFYSIGYTIRK